MDVVLVIWYDMMLVFLVYKYFRMFELDEMLIKVNWRLDQLIDKDS